MDQSAEVISTLDVVWSGRDGEWEHWPLRVGRHQVEGAVRLVAVVVVDDDAEHSLEVPPVAAARKTRAAGLSSGPAT